MLPRPSTLLFLYIALLKATLAEDASSTGTDSWGMRVYVSRDPRECAPFHLYYDINRDGTPPGPVVLPDAGAISFLTPDNSGTEWMELRPPMGTGLLSWTCALPAGTQFVILNRTGFRRMFTVGPASGSSACWRNTSSVATSSAYGSLDADVYRALIAGSYTPTSVLDQFNPVEMPDTRGLNVIQVSLGAAGRATQQPTSSPSPTAPETPSTGTTTGTGTAPANGGLQKQPDLPTDTSPTIRTRIIPTSRTEQLGESPAAPPSIESSGQTKSPSSRASHERLGLIVGVVIAALALGGVSGALLVVLVKRRRKRLAAGSLRLPPDRAEFQRVFARRSTHNAEEEPTAHERSAGMDTSSRAQEKRAPAPRISTAHNLHRRSDPTSLRAPATDFEASEDPPSYRTSGGSF